jgi:hypothetical protein
MKRLYASALLFALSGSIFAQQRQGPVEATITTSRIERLIGSDRNQNKVEGRKLDTLMGNLMKSSGFAVYSYPSDPKNPLVMSPLTGTNKMFVAIGEKFSFSVTGTVSGVLVAYQSKTIAGAPDDLGCGVIMCDSANNPSGEFSTFEMFSAASIDTSSTTLRFTPIVFSKPAAVTGDFSIFVETHGMGNGDPSDQEAIYTNMQGDGKGERRLYYVVADSAGNLGVGYMDDLVKVGGKPIDIDLVAAPIVEVSSSSAGVAAYPTVNGVTLHGTFPNPASSSTSIEFSLQKSSPVDLKLIDIQGRVIRTMDQGNLEAGDHRIDLDLNGLPAGNYMYAITTRQGEVAGKITVAR